MISFNYLNLSWTKNDLMIVIPIVLALVCFIIYWFSSKSKIIENYISKKFGKNKTNEYQILFSRINGFFWLGIIPLYVTLILFPDLSFLDLGLGINPSTRIQTLIWTFVLSLVFIPLTVHSAKNPKRYNFYPQIKSKVWNKSLLIKNSIGWALYLLGYEILFRGVLLFPLVKTIGIWPAIAINVMFYSATHIPKSFIESLVCIPFGTIVCLVTLTTGTIWAATVVHILIAVANSFSAIYNNPNMNFKF